MALAPSDFFSEGGGQVRKIHRKFTETQIFSYASNSAPPPGKIIYPPMIPTNIMTEGYFVIRVGHFFFFLFLLHMAYIPKLFSFWFRIFFSCNPTSSFASLNFFFFIKYCRPDLDENRRVFWEPTACSENLIVSVFGLKSSLHAIRLEQCMS